MLAIGERVRERRIKMGLSQSKLAQMLMVSQAAINAIERGRKLPGLAMARDLARVFNITVDELLQDGEEEKESVVQA